MIQVIRFKNLEDGYELKVQVEGKLMLTNGIIERTKMAIEEQKADNDKDWDFDGVVNAACDYLETEGYMCYLDVFPDYEIEV